MKRNLLLHLSLQFRNYATTFCFAPLRSSQIPTLGNICSVAAKLTANSLDGSLSFRSTTSSSQHLRVRRPSFSPNLSRPFPLTHLVPMSTLTSLTNISFTSLPMILGMATFSSTYELKSLVITYHEIIVDAFAIRPPLSPPRRHPILVGSRHHSSSLPDY
jgi:hypothetical protein